LCSGVLFSTKKIETSYITKEDEDTEENYQCQNCPVATTKTTVIAFSERGINFQI
jgi:hypothetical protein